jgi:uncharacterized protein
LTRPKLALAWPRDPDFAAIAQPLLDDGTVNALSWSVEQGFRPPPAAVTQALDRVDTVVGHGVHLSPGTPGWGVIDAAWLARARLVFTRFPVKWVSEHFGWLRAGTLHAAPLPLPPGEHFEAACINRLKRMAHGFGVPVGLENLALATSYRDAWRQAAAVSRILDAVDGIAVLDLHNLWCAAINYDIVPTDLAAGYPLDRVVEVHLSGGSWMSYPEGNFRRDTHDGPVPEAVWTLFEDMRCHLPKLEVVTLERMPGTLTQGPEAFRDEVRKLAALLDTPARQTARGSATQVAPSSSPMPASGQGEVLRALRAGGGPHKVVENAGAGAKWLSGWDRRALRAAEAITAKYAKSTIPGL